MGKLNGKVIWVASICHHDWKNGRLVDSCLAATSKAALAEAVGSSVGRIVDGAFFTLPAGDGNAFAVSISCTELIAKSRGKR